MATFAVARWSETSWRARRPWVRRRLRETLEAHSGGPSLRVWDLARAAGIEDIPSDELQAIVTDLIDAGLAEGLRGPTGWWYVRATGYTPRDWEDIEEDETVPMSGGGGGWMMSPAMAWAGPSSARAFSVATRVPRHNSNSVLAGIGLFLLAAAVAALVVVGVLRAVPGPSAPPPPSQEDWYASVSRGFVEKHMAGEIGFALPHRFTDTTGVREGATPEVLEWGITQYLKSALFTGYPSQLGILAWARGQFGEYPGGAAGDAWIHRAAETYAARSLEGTAGYELTDALLTTGSITPGERDAIAVTAGLERAIRAGLFLGTPVHGGLLDWARRTNGDLPPR